ncbi:MAG: hypothetical protein HY738_12080 [Bacteroidia bacterium]|nr:hypothetical protein [Bacteroidia bacterium]
MYRVFIPIIIILVILWIIVAFVEDINNEQAEENSIFNAEYTEDSIDNVEVSYSTGKFQVLTGKLRRYSVNHFSVLLPLWLNEYHDANRYEDLQCKDEHELLYFTVKETDKQQFAVQGNDTSLVAFYNFILSYAADSTSLISWLGSKKINNLNCCQAIINHISQTQDYYLVLSVFSSPTRLYRTYTWSKNSDSTYYKQLMLEIPETFAEIE